MRAPRSRLPREHVIAIRTRVGSGENPHAVAAEFGIRVDSIRGMMRGERYAEIPEGIVPDYTGVRRGQPSEVVLFMRLIYPRASCKKIAKAFNLDIEVVRNMLLGKTYREIPEAHSSLAATRCERNMTDEQCRQARRLYRTRQIPARALAAEYGFRNENGRFAEILRGYGYKDVPGAVPEHVTYQRRGLRRSPRRDASASSAPE